MDGRQIGKTMLEHIVETVCFGSKKDLIKSLGYNSPDEIEHLGTYIWTAKPMRISGSRYSTVKSKDNLVGYITTKPPVCSSKEGDRYKYKDVWMHYDDLFEDKHRYEVIEYDIEVD